MIKGHASFPQWPLHRLGHIISYIKENSKHLKNEFASIWVILHATCFSHVWKSTGRLNHGTRQNKNLPGVEEKKCRDSWEWWIFLANLGGVNWSAGSYQEVHHLSGQLEVLKKTVPVIDRFSEPLNLVVWECLTGSLSLSAPSSCTPTSSRTTSAHFLTGVSHGAIMQFTSSLWGVNLKGPSGHPGEVSCDTHKLWSPPCVTAGLGNRLSWQETRRLSWSPTINLTESCTREPAFYF